MQKKAYQAVDTPEDEVEGHRRLAAIVSEETTEDDEVAGHIKRL